MLADKMDPKFPVYATFIRDKAPVTTLMFNDMVKRASKQNGWPLIYRESQTKPPALTHLFQFIIYNFSIIQNLIVMQLKKHC